MSVLDNLINRTTDVIKANIEGEEVKTVETEEEAEAEGFDFSTCYELTTPVESHVTCDVLNVRSDASTDKKRIGQLKRGDKITVVAVCEDWLCIEYNKEKAFVFGKYTDFQAAELTVTASVLNVRKGAGTNFDKIGSLPKGTVVKVLADHKGWAKILYNKRVGYVSKEYLK